VFNRSRLHVGDIATSVTEEQLRALFEQVGEIETLHYPLTATHKPQGYAFVQMKTAEATREAIKRFNGFSFHGKTLFVYAMPPRSYQRGRSPSEIK
jgi:RNA recognition motif-containing protein